MGLDPNIIPRGAGIDMTNAEWTSVGQLQVDNGQYPVYRDMGGQPTSDDQGMYGGGYTVYQGMGQ